MAISFTVSYTFSPSTTISSSQVNTNFSDEANVWAGIEAKTKTFSNLGVDTELKSGGTVSAANGTVAAPAITFTNSTGSGLYRIGADDIGFATAGVIGLEINNAQAVIIRGVATNSSAAAGMVGEYISSSITSATNFPATGVYGDGTSISLTAGDWDVSLVACGTINGATQTSWRIGISQTTGNSGTGLVTGDNLVFCGPPSATTDVTLTISGYRQSLASTTTVYAKVQASFSAGTPQYTLRLSARRVR